MLVPSSWLRDYVAVDASTEEIAAQLTISSCEVNGVHRRGPPDFDDNLGLYRVGQVLDAIPHANADRLWLCEVDVGEAAPRQIVCGASNVAAGVRVAVALPGAALPDGQRTIETRRIRGVLSDGILLSAQELGIGADGDRILLLDQQVPPGTLLADVLCLSEEILDVEVTGNRPDLLSIYGFAREVAALLNGELRPVPGIDSPAPDATFELHVREPERCLRYIGRLFDDLRIVPSAVTLAARLTAAGVRPISNVVDVTNYVMLALGSPLHAFDADAVSGGRIVVRAAEAGERIRTLDGRDRILTAEELVIADADRAIAIAGIMGGESTEVTDETTRVIVEAGSFDALSILRSSRRLHLRTESSSRWEKGVDPHLAPAAAVLATQMIIGHTGARWAAQADFLGALPDPPVINVRPNRVDALIGVATSPERQRAILKPLGFEVRSDSTVRVPTWRAQDVTREVDIVEEVARVELERIPFRMPKRDAMFGSLTDEQRLIRRLQDIAVGAGLYEVCTPSLMPDDPDPHAYRLPDPASVEQSTLRTTLLRALMAAARHNLDAGNDEIRLFEIARVYLPVGRQLPDERYRFGGIVAGDFYLAKSMVQAVHEALAIPTQYERGTSPDLHCGKTAWTVAGWLGELLPNKLPGTWSGFELDVSKLLALAPRVIVYDDFITYPAIKEDLAFSVPDQVPAGTLVAAAREAAGHELRDMRVFDVYTGEQVGPGRRSIAFSVAYQAPDRTLTETDAARLRERIVNALALLDARLRS